ncbi:MAG: NYN domain-containing protein [Candidatus Kerfeldbacteria bacterium]|nr:NYN domain-containing protein [Candidatus Kerfeldbacteria bacterium]
MVINKNQRVGVFVDVQNMYHSAKHLYNANVNFKHVLIDSVNGRQLIRALAYVVASESPEEEAFFEALESQGFEVRSKGLQVFASGQKKADWDVGMAVDAIKLADRLDTVVLVSGDGDFVPLVRYLQENKGCFVELMSFKESTSSALIQEVDAYVDLSAGASRYLLTKSSRRKSE